MEHTGTTMTTPTAIMTISCKYICLWEVTHCTHFSVKASPDTRISRSQTILDRSLFTTQAVWKLITSDTNILSCPRHLYKDNYCREKTRKWSWKNFLERGAQYDSTAPVGSTPTSAPTESDVDWGRNLLEPRKSRAPGRKKKRKREEKKKNFSRFFQQEEWKEVCSQTHGKPLAAWIVVKILFFPKRDSIRIYFAAAISYLRWIKHEKSERPILGWPSRTIVLWFPCFEVADSFWTRTKPFSSHLWSGCRAHAECYIAFTDWRMDGKR